MRPSARPLEIILHPLVLILFLTLTYAAAHISLSAARSRVNPRYITNLTVKIKNGTLYNDFRLIRELSAGLRCYIDFQLRIANSKTYQSLFHFDIDLCRTIVAQQNHLFKSWYRDMLKHSNYMENCPFDPDHYYISNWTVGPSLIPKYLFAGDYKISFFVYYGQYKKKGMDFVVEVEVDIKIE